MDVLAAVGDVPRSAIEMVHLHHERDNGKGYPASLDGNQIPVYARLAALVDCFDAITIERPYKKPLAACDALKIIQEAALTFSVILFVPDDVLIRKVRFTRIFFRRLVVTL